MTELWRLPAAELAQLVRTRRVSAKESAEAALRRLEAVNPPLNAIVEHRPERVLEQADALDRMLASDMDPGPLAGVPVTMKVNIDEAGFATTNGIRLQKDLVAQVNSPVVDNLLHAGALLLGRSNTPAFSLRWFTSNLVHGSTRNPHDPALTPGGSSGGGAAAVAAGIGCLAVGTDIGGSIRYPAYACGVHGLRPTLGRVPVYNATSAERSIGGQLMSTTGPMARSIEDLSIGLAAMAAADPRDPWWAPAPLEGAASPRHAALCLRPGGMQIVREVEAALLDAKQRLVDAGWKVEEIEDVPSIHAAAEVQEHLWLGDGFTQIAEAAEREGDPGALAVIAGVRARAERLPTDVVSQALVRRATLTREWQVFLTRYSVLLLPVSAELPFPNELDLQGEAAFERVWKAQLVMRAIPAMGLPGLSVATNVVGSTPVGVQIVAGRYREDLCLLAGEAIEKRGTARLPVDPRG